MQDDISLSRRSFALGLAALPLAPRAISAQGTPVASANAPIDDVGLIPPARIRSVDFLVSWNDMAGYLRSIGLSDPYADVSVPSRFMSPLATIDPLTKAAFVEDVPQVFGFRPLDVHRIVSVGKPPAAMTIYRGGIDTKKVSSALMANGYSARDQNGTPWYTIGEQGEISLESVVTQLAIGEMNNIALLSADTIACASYSSTLKRVMALHQQGRVSIADSPDVANALAPLPASVASIMMFGGDVAQVGMLRTHSEQQIVSEHIDSQIATSDAAVGSMPSASLVGGAYVLADPAATPVAATPGDGDSGTAMLFTAYDSEEHAAQAVRVIEWRLKNLKSAFTGEPYTVVLPDAMVAQYGRTARVTLGDNGPSRWTSLLNHLELLAFAY